METCEDGPSQVRPNIGHFSHLNWDCKVEDDERMVRVREGLESIGEDFALRSKVVVKTCCFDNIDPDILCYVLDTS